MCIDEVMEYLVNYGIYGTRFRQVKNALLKYEESEIIEEIIQSIDNFKNEKNVATTISNVKLVNLPEDIKIGMKIYDYVSVPEESNPDQNAVDLASISSKCQKIHRFNDQIRDFHDEITGFSFKQTPNIPTTDVILSKKTTTIYSLLKKV